jgi:adenylate kinase family enzyme
MVTLSVPSLPAAHESMHRWDMRRIVILGNAGSGKSTLARRLGAILGLPVSHLDVLFWRPGWVEPDAAGFRERVAQSIAGDGWISEGNYSSRTFDLRIPRADTLIWLDTPRATCVRRVIWRTLFEGRRADLAEGCHENVLRADFPEFLRFTWDFDRNARPRIEANLAGFAPIERTIRLAGPRQGAAWLREVQGCR